MEQESPTLRTHKSAKYRIVMVRHGESEWNTHKMFAGWYDTDLTAKGVDQAKRAGIALKLRGYKFDYAHSSLLVRAQKTLGIILQELEQSDVPVCKTWRLNERNCGALTGLTVSQACEEYGAFHVQKWRHTFSHPPPPLEKGHRYYETILNDPRYKTDFKVGEFPRSESLKQVIERIIPYWKDVIVPQILDGKNIIVVAHLLVLQGMIKYMKGEPVSTDHMVRMKIPNAVPFVCELDGDMKPLFPIEFLFT